MAKRLEGSVITDSDRLADLCARLRHAGSLAVDTEFMRERTYWPILCLVQVASADEAAAIDPLAEGMTLDPLFALLRSRAVLKVFHSARQDLEIFFHLMGEVPAPLFDTQVAAMVLGFGDAISFENLAAKLARVRIDKDMRFTDWSRRPLSDKQIRYALDDVIYLRPIHEELARRLEDSGRRHWLTEEMALLSDPETYRLEPDKAWRRLKPRSANPRRLAILRELAAWREREAQRRNLPRRRILRDEPLLQIAAHAPRTMHDLKQVRGLGRALEGERSGPGLIEAVARARAIPEADCPQPQERLKIPNNTRPLVDLLKVLLKANCTAQGVAQRLVANTEDLEAIAASDAPDLAALKGWRYEIFGKDALALKSGRVALAVEKGRVALVERKAPKKRKHGS